MASGEIMSGSPEELWGEQGDGVPGEHGLDSGEAGLQARHREGGSGVQGAHPHHQPCLHGLG